VLPFVPISLQQRPRGNEGAAYGHTTKLLHATRGVDTHPLVPVLPFVPISLQQIAHLYATGA
jgi:hypothetical protein